MYIVIIAWAYVAFMMAVAEATSTDGTLLGAAFTLLLYGVLPCALLVYIRGTPARKRAIRAREAMENAATDINHPAQALDAPDAGGHTPADAVAPVRKET